MDNPQFPEAFNVVVGMGAPQRYFRIKSLNRIGSLVASFVFLGGAVLVFLYGVYEAYLAYQEHGPATMGNVLTWPVIVAFILFLLALAAGWAAYVNWNKGVALYEQGFVVRDRKGIQAWRWEEIVSLRAAVTRHYTNGIYTGTTHVYTLYNRQNERLVFSDIYVKVEELAKAIEQGIFPHLYERAAQQYNLGQTLAFGPVAISKTGIQISKKVYPWTEVQQVTVQRGFLKVSKKGGGWFSGASAAASAIPNLSVLLNMIHQVVGLKTG
jgi:hypothetical protein